jgi:prepilin-type N-terminal cleavage/methylation domain-containing protein
MRTSSTTKVFAGAVRPGFTFIELLVVTVLIAILAGSSIHGTARTFKKMQVERAAREILLSAQFARIQAIESQRSCRLILDKSTRSLMVLATIPERTYAVVRNAYARPFQFADEVEYEMIAITPTRPPEDLTQETALETTITFRPDGSADGAVIQVGNGTTHYTIYVSSATGSARVEHGPADENTPLMVADLDQNRL